MDTLREKSTYESLAETRLIIESKLTQRTAEKATEEEIEHLEEN